MELLFFGLNKIIFYLRENLGGAKKGYGKGTWSKRKPKSHSRNQKCQ
jgi:hypothetical protein